jgi:hypothetical protein
LLRRAAFRSPVLRCLVNGQGPTSSTPTKAYQQQPIVHKERGDGLLGEPSTCAGPATSTAQPTKESSTADHRSKSFSQSPWFFLHTTGRRGPSPNGVPHGYLPCGRGSSRFPSGFAPSCLGWRWGCSTWRWGRFRACSHPWSPFPWKSPTPQAPCC